MFNLFYIDLYDLYNLHLYLLIHLLYVLFSASIRHARISAIEKPSQRHMPFYIKVKVHAYSGYPLRILIPIVTNMSVHTCILVI